MILDLSDSQLKEETLNAYQELSNSSQKLTILLARMQTFIKEEEAKGNKFDELISIQLKLEYMIKIVNEGIKENEDGEYYRKKLALLNAANKQVHHWLKQFGNKKPQNSSSLSQTTAVTKPKTPESLQNTIAKYIANNKNIFFSQLAFTRNIDVFMQQYPQLEVRPDELLRLRANEIIKKMQQDKKLSEESIKNRITNALNCITEALKKDNPRKEVKEIIINLKKQTNAEFLSLFSQVIKPYLEELDAISKQHDIDRKKYDAAVELGMLSPYGNAYRNMNNEGDELIEAQEEMTNLFQTLKL